MEHRIIFATSNEGKMREVREILKGLKAEVLSMKEAGVSVAEGSVELPADKSEYSEYASDGTTLVKESCSFSGTVEFNGAPHEWSSVLLYDYATANTSGNLADTVRIIYVYVNA